MDWPQAIAVASTILGITLTVQKLVPKKNGFNQKVCDIKHQEITCRLEELKLKHDRELELLTSKTDSQIKEISTKLDLLTASINRLNIAISRLDERVKLFKVEG